MQVCQFLRIRHSVLLRVLSNYPNGLLQSPSSSPTNPLRCFTSLPEQLQSRSDRSRSRDAAAAADFRVLRTVAEVETIVQRLGPRLTGKHLCAAFSRVHQLSPASQSQTVTLLTNKAMQLAPSMSAHEVVFLLSACSRLRHMEVSLFEALSQRLLMRECMLQMNEVLVAECVMSVARLQKERLLSSADQTAQESAAAPLTVHFEVMQELARLVLGQGFLERIRTSALVNIIYGFGLLRYHSPPFQEAVAEEIAKGGRLRSMRFDEVIRVWKAFGQLQILDKDALLALCDEMSRVDRLRGFNAAELEAILSTSKQLLPFRNAPLLLNVIQEVVKPDRMRRFTEMQLVSIMEALHSMRIRDEEVISVLLNEMTKRNRLPFFTQQSMSTILYALKSLGYGHHPKMQQLLAHGDQILHERHLSDQQLLSFVFGKRRSDAEDILCSKMLNRILTPTRIAAYSDLALSGILAGLHQQEVTDQAMVTSCVGEIVKRLQSATPQVLSYYAYGLRINKVDSHEALSAFASEVVKEEKIKHFKPSQLAGVVYSLAMLGWKSRSTYDALFKEICQPQNLNETSEKGLANVVTAVQCSNTAINAPVDAILQEATQPHRLLQFSERSLMSLIRNFGRMRLQERRFTAPVLQELTKPGRLARLTNLEFSDLIYNLAQMRFKSAAALDRIKEEVLKSHRLAKFRTMELCSVVYGFGGIRLLNQGLIRAIALHIDACVDVSTLRNCEITNLIHGLGGMRCTGHPCVPKLLTEVMKVQRLEALTAPEFTSLVYGMGNLPDIDASFVHQLMEASSKSEQLPTLSNQQLTHVFVSMVNLLESILDSRLPQPLVKEMHNPERLKQFRPFQLMDVVNVLCRDVLWEHRKSLAEALAHEVSRPERLATMTQADLTVVSRRLSQAGCKDLASAKRISEAILRRFLAATADRKDDVTE